MKACDLSRTRSALVSLVRCSLAALLFLVAATGWAMAAGLLQPVSPSDRAAADAASRSNVPLAAIRHRLVRINAGELARHVVPVGLDSVPNRAQRAQGLDGIVTMELFPDVVVTFHRTEVEAVGDSGYAWTGEVPDRPFSSATLIVDGGRITGSVQLFRRLFRIDPVGEGVHRVTEIDRRKYPRQLNDAVEPPPHIKQRMQREGDAKPTTKDVRAKTTVRLLAAYTKRAKQEAANVVDLIKLAVTMANTAYKNTGVQIKLVLAGTMSAGNYDEGADTANQWSEVLSDVSGFNGASTLATVRNKRDALQADLVTLIVADSSLYCGLAWVISNPSSGTSEYGFSEIAHGCLPDGIVLPHELGHNMGLLHDRYTNAEQGGGNPSNAFYNFGYVNLTDRIVSIMAYTSACSAVSVVCSYVQWFSTPKKEYNGTSKLGVAQGKKGAADATRRLNETRTGISQYR